MQKIFIHILCLLFASSAYAGKAKYLSLTKTGSQEEQEHSTSELLKASLELVSFRHKVLSQNLANVNTPNYKAQEVAAPKEYGDLTKGGSNRQVMLAKTNNKHIGEGRESKGKFVASKLEDPYEIKPNGNNVSLAQQMTKISQNQQDYNAAIKGYSATNALISAVIGK